MSLLTVGGRKETWFKLMENNSLARKLWNLCVSPKYRFLVLSTHGFFHAMSDEAYLKKKFKYLVGTDLDLENPRTFNEKLQWLKLYDRNPEYTIMVDKYAAKKWAANRIGEEYIIPTIGIWDNFDDIDFDELPDKFVLKCTHDSGGIVIVDDKSKMNKAATKKKLERNLKQNFYWPGREWPYKNVPRKIIAEKYLTDESGIELKDYKVFNFDGKPKLIQVDYSRFAEHKRNLYSTDWKYIEAVIQYPTDPACQISKPECFDKLLELAAKLSKGFPHVRTDFYCIDNKIYFGELTLYHGAGFEKFDPSSLGEQMGDWIKLPSGGAMLRRENMILYARLLPLVKPQELMDYKFMCFNGKVRCLFVCSDRYEKTGLKVTFFDRHWNRLPFERHYPVSNMAIDKPTNCNKMIELAEVLAKDIPFVRVDFYEANGQVYFGEMTLYPGSGFEEFTPVEWDEKLGSWIDLPKR